MGHGSEVLIGWPLIKWLAGGAATIIGVLGAVIWKKQQATVAKLGDKVEELAHDSRSYATHEHVEELRKEIRGEMKSMRSDLQNHNDQVTTRLDTVLVEVLRLDAKASNRRRDDKD